MNMEGFQQHWFLAGTGPKSIWTNEKKCCELGLRKGLCIWDHSEPCRPGLCHNQKGVLGQLGVTHVFLHEGNDITT